MRIPENAGHGIFIPGNDKEVNVVPHQAIAKDRKRVSGGVF
jgi:hypothetical protein